MAAPVVASAQHSSGNGSTSITVTAPSGVADGDLLVVFIGINSSISISAAPSGWTLQESRSNGAVGLAVSVYTKIASSEGASWTWTASASANYAAHALRVTGHDASTFYNIDGSQANTSASTSVTAPTITTTEDDCLLLYCGYIKAATTFTAPSGMTEVLDGQSGSSNRTMETASETFATAGATGTRAATAGTSDVSIAVLLALAPSTAVAFPHHPLLCLFP